MSFEIKVLGDENCPMLFCDHCGERINRVRDGVYLWAAGGGHIWFTHHNSIGTERCHEAMERKFGKIHPWNHLREFFKFLTTNLPAEPTA